MGQEERRPVRKRMRRLIEEEVAQIKAHLQQGKPPTIIARYFEVHPKTIYAIRAKKAHQLIGPAAKATPLLELVKAKRVRAIANGQRR
jgi:O-phosphoseryl-tRNA(Cys) synthetase